MNFETVELSRTPHKQCRWEFRIATSSAFVFIARGRKPLQLLRPHDVVLRMSKCPALAHLDPKLGSDENGVKVFDRYLPDHKKVRIIIKILGALVGLPTEYLDDILSAGYFASVISERATPPETPGVDHFKNNNIQYESFQVADGHSSHSGNTSPTISQKDKQVAEAIKVELYRQEDVEWGRSGEGPEYSTTARRSELVADLIKPMVFFVTAHGASGHTEFKHIHAYYLHLYASLLESKESISSVSDRFDPWMAETQSHSTHFNRINDINDYSIQELIHNYYRFVRSYVEQDEDIRKDIAAVELHKRPYTGRVDHTDSTINEKYIHRNKEKTGLSYLRFATLKHVIGGLPIPRGIIPITKETTKRELLAELLSCLPGDRTEISDEDHMLAEFKQIVAILLPDEFGEAITTDLGDLSPVTTIAAPWNQLLQDMPPGVGSKAYAKDITVCLAAKKSRNPRQKVSNTRIFRGGLAEVADTSSTGQMIVNVHPDGPYVQSDPTGKSPQKRGWNPLDPDSPPLTPKFIEKCLSGWKSVISDPQIDRFELETSSPSHSYRTFNFAFAMMVQSQVNIADHLLSKWFDTFSDEDLTFDIGHVAQDLDKHIGLAQL